MPVRVGGMNGRMDGSMHLLHLHPSWSWSWSWNSRADGTAQWAAPCARAPDGNSTEPRRCRGA